MKNKSHSLARDAGARRRRFAMTLPLGLPLVALLVLAGLALLGFDAGSTGAAPVTAGAGTVSASTTVAVFAGTVASAAGTGAITTRSSVPAVTTKPTSPGDSDVVFRCSVLPVGEALAAEMTKSGSWRPEDPVSLADLCLIQATYWGFDGRTHTGTLVVDRTWSVKLCGVLHTIYDAHFPIRGMDLVDVYGADDDRSMAADNTSAYNGRRVSGTNSWSMHAYGLAIDINPLENPYIHGGIVSPEEGAVYVDRSIAAPGMIEPGDVVVQAFAAIGWEWGGNWKSCKDYQHFSSNGR